MHDPASPDAVSPGKRPWRLNCLGVGLAALLAVVTWAILCATPAEEWTGARLLPSFLLLSGEPIYSGPLAGPEILWCYGPVMPIVYTPVALLGRILPLTRTLLLAGALNVAWLLVPGSLCILASARRFGTRSGTGLLLPLGFWATLVAIPCLRAELYVPMCDQVAMGLVTLSCLLLAAHLNAPSAWRFHAAAALSVASVWSKQIEVVVPLAQLAALLILGRGKEARAYCWSLFLAAAGWLLLFGWAFGLGDMFYGLWTIPSGHPLKGGAGYVGWQFLRVSAYVVPALALGWAARRRLKAADPLNVLLVVCMVALMPLSALGASKVDGGENSYHSVYFAALVAWTAVAALPVRWSVTGSAVAVVAVSAFAVRTPWFRLNPDEFVEGELVIAREHPGQVYVPGNPLITWLTDHKVYHFEEGIVEEALAGYPMPKQRFWEYLPPHLRTILYPEPYFPNPPVTFIIPHEAPWRDGRYRVYPVPKGTVEEALRSVVGKR